MIQALVRTHEHPVAAQAEMKKTNLKLIHNNLVLMRYKILFCDDKNKFKHLFKEINSCELFSYPKSFLHATAAKKFAASADKMGLSLKHIKEANRLSSDEKQYIFLKKIIEIQIEKAKNDRNINEIESKQEEVTENLNIVTQKVKDIKVMEEKPVGSSEQNIVNNIISSNNINSAIVVSINAALAEVSSNNSESNNIQQENNKVEIFDSEEKYLANLNPKEFHDYWQSAKNNEIAKFENSAPQNKDWNINGYTIDPTSTIKTYNKFGVAYNSFLPNKIRESLGQERAAFEEAATKLVKSGQGNNGIKFLNKDDVELKVIGTDTRVLGRHYKIGDEHIFVFDQILNHKGVKRNIA